MRINWPSDVEDKRLTIENVEKVRDRGYVCAGEVRSLISLFSVPKAVGTDMKYIRVVYNAKKCKLYLILWVPNFYLPTVSSALRLIESKSWFGDLNKGDFFKNYSLHPDMRKYAGVDVTEMDCKYSSNQVIH